MTHDHNKKTVRHFQCRDYLWEIFEHMGAELECSTDYLINEAMRQYARSRNWGSRAAPAVRHSGSATPTAAPNARRPPFPAPVASVAAPRAAAAPEPMGMVARTRSGSFPPPLPGGAAAAAMPRTSLPSLYVIFNGQKVPVDKEEFVIGRGSKTADLPIKDGNISRRHAAIVLQNGAFYMKDLGSTNGVEYQGHRIESRRIEEGDVYHLCDYELRFTYQ